MNGPQPQENDSRAGERPENADQFAALQRLSLPSVRNESALSSATLPAAPAADRRSVWAEMRDDLLAAGVGKLRLFSYAGLGVVSEGAKWLGSYALSALALQALVERSPNAPVFMVAAVVLFLVADQCDDVWRTAVDSGDRAFFRRLKERLIDRVGRFGLRELHDVDQQANLELQQERARNVSNVVEAISITPSYATKLALSGGVLLATDWRLGVLVGLAVTPGFLLKSRQTKQDIQLEERQARRLKITERLDDEISRFEGAFRIAVLGLSRCVARARVTQQALLDKEKDSHEWRQSRQMLLSNAAYYGAVGVGLSLLYSQYGAGAISVGSLMFLAHQLIEVGEELSAHGDTFQGYRRIALEARGLYQFLSGYETRGAKLFPAEHAIALRDVRFSRGDFEVQVPSGTIAPGELVIVHGGNGAGKTTLLQSLAGALQPSRGEVLVGGVAAHEIAPEEWRAHIGYCGVSPALMEGRTVREILQGDDDEGTLNLRRLHPLVAPLLQQLEATGLGLETRVGAELEHGRAFSTGELRWLTLVHAMVPRPRLLFLDEVTSNQSDEVVELIKQCIAEHRERGTIVIFVTHSKQFDGVASRIWKVTKGEVEVVKNEASSGAGDGAGPEFGVARA